MSIVLTGHYWQNIHIDYHGPDHGFQAASPLAKNVARENQMMAPTIMAWHQDSTLGTTPSYSGANPETWWENTVKATAASWKYGWATTTSSS